MKWLYGGLIHQPTTGGPHLVQKKQRMPPDMIHWIAKQDGETRQTITNIVIKPWNFGTLRQLGFP